MSTTTERFAARDMKALVELLKALVELSDTHPTAPRVGPGYRAIAVFDDPRNPCATSQIVFVLAAGSARSVVAHRDGRVFTLDNAALS